VSGGWLTHPLLSERGVEHGFGLRNSTPPVDLHRPNQVHGARIVAAAACGGPDRPDADGVVSAAPGVRVAVVTADCVPILLASSGGHAVAALHAGWRGLAAGVVAAGVAALAELAPAPSSPVATIGPHIGPCCYEIDDSVSDALRPQFGSSLDSALTPTRPGHAWLDLGALAREALLAAGLAAAAVGSLCDVCTRCDAERFHSYRRDGGAAGRLVHFIAARQQRA
jgi:YfiH family protein